MARKEYIGGDHEPARLQLDYVCKGNLEVTFGAGIQDMEIQPERVGRRQHLPRLALSKSGIGRVNEQGDDAGRRKQLVQQLQPLRRYLHARLSHARDVAARAVRSEERGGGKEGTSR